MLFAPLLSMLWTALAKRGLEPSIPVKFSHRPGRRRRGLPVPGVRIDASPAPDNFQVGLWWLAGLYLIHSIAELCISPVGLSMVTKLSIARIVGLMMGVWFLSISVAQYFAGIVAQFASVETVGGQVTNLKVSLDTYIAHVHHHCLDRDRRGRRRCSCSSWPLKKWMHGVK